MVVRDTENTFATYFFLLFVDVSNLEPDILFAQRSGRVIDNVFEALRVLSECAASNTATAGTNLQALLELLLLLVDYAETEVNLVGLFKSWVHAHDLGEGFFGVLEGSVAVVKDSDAVPKLGLLSGI